MSSSRWHDPRADSVAAADLEADKRMYEAVYEARNDRLAGHPMSRGPLTAGRGRMTVREMPSDPPGCPPKELDRLVGGAHHDPHAVLGAHPVPPSGDGAAAAPNRW